MNVTIVSLWFPGWYYNKSDYTNIFSDSMKFCSVTVLCMLFIHCTRVKIAFVTFPFAFC